MQQCRFKIDFFHAHFNDAHKVEGYGLTRARDYYGFFGRKTTVWETLGTFKTRADARARYEVIKDLPEYLP